MHDVFHIGFLRLVDDLDGGIILHQGEIAVHIVTGLADGLGDEGAGSIVHGGEESGDFRMVGNERGFVVGIVNAAQGGFAVGDVPDAIVAREFEINDADMVAPIARHALRHVVHRAFFQIDVRRFFKFLVREAAMGMTKDHGINAFDASEVESAILRAFLIGFVGWAGVRQRHDDVRAGFKHDGYVFFCGFHDIARFHLAIEMRLVPHHHLRRHEADIADIERVGIAFFVLYFFLLNHIGLIDGFFRAGFDDIGIDDGEGCLLDGFIEIGQAIVEFMVAERADVVAHEVERFNGRVRLAFFVTGGGLVIGNGIALNEVAVIDEHAVCHFLTRLFDEGGGARKAESISGRVLVIIKIGQKAVDVGCADDAQGYFFGGGSKGMAGVEYEQRTGAELQETSSVH